MEKSYPKYILCKHCLTPVVVSDTADIYLCSQCGSITSADLAQSIYNYVHDVVYWGVLYRHKYEEQKREHGRIVMHYSLMPPSDFLILIAIGVISAIIGNLSYDTIKVLISRLSKSLSRNGIEPRHYEETIIASEKFVIYLRETIKNQWQRNDIKKIIISEQSSQKLRLQSNEIIEETLQEISIRISKELKDKEHQDTK